MAELPFSTSCHAGVGRSSGVPQTNIALQTLYHLRIADHGLEEVLLVEGHEHGLADLRVVERLVQRC